MSASNLHQVATFCPPPFLSIISLPFHLYCMVHSLDRKPQNMWSKGTLRKSFESCMDRYQNKRVHPPPPNITSQPYTFPFPQSSNTGAGGYGQYGNCTFSLEPVDELLLDFKPWLVVSRWWTRLPSTVINGNQQTVVKSWDSYKHDSSRRDNEVSRYMRIQSLWNACVPHFIGKGDLDFCHSLFVEFVKLKPLVIMFLQLQGSQ